ncbi:MAG: SUMF1/EgtB/PvdO family nonheme iron enzyme [Terracidiphilus sp.]|jgi:ergothioneine biosynthesis protein EgtB
MSVLAALPQTRDYLLLRLAESRRVTDDMFRIVRTESLYDRPIPERNRINFYIGHLEAFDWNLIAGQALGLGNAHKEFDDLFAFGIDPVDGGLPQDKPSDWPSLPETRAYSMSIRDKIDSILNGHSGASASDWQYPEQLILNVAIEHRLMHAETLAYMFHQLSPQQKVVPHSYRPIDNSQSGQPINSRMIEIPAGTATLGMQKEESFGWDNEFEEHSVAVPAFAIGVHKVTNGEFLKFVREGGYDERRFWSNSDWAWMKEQGIGHPGFWFMRGGQWFYRTMFEELPLPLDWPVYVSYAEAAAYACFADKSLPTEAEFHRSAYGAPEGTERNYPWGDALPDASRGNFDFMRWDPVAVGSYPEGRSAFGLEDALGNGWEWTSSNFAPLPGFEPFPFYRGYSANFFDNNHYVVKGASPRTAACMLRRSFRNWFQPHYPYVYATFRCVSH